MLLIIILISQKPGILAIGRTNIRISPDWPAQCNELLNSPITGKCRNRLNFSWSYYNFVSYCCSCDTKL